MIVDSVKYPDGREPDLGTIKCVGYSYSDSYDEKSHRQREIREYEGLSEDLDKLLDIITYSFLATGSSCLFTDNSELYKWNEVEQAWRKMG